MCSVHVSLVPVIGVVGEQKTKPTQHSVQVGAVGRSVGAVWAQWGVVARSVGAVGRCGVQCGCSGA